MKTLNLTMKCILNALLCSALCVSFSCKQADLQEKKGSEISSTPAGPMGLLSVVNPVQLKNFDYPAGSTNRLFKGVACGNFDGSGIATMAIIKRATSHVIFMRSANDGSHYQIPFSFDVTSGNDFKGVAAGDMNGDGIDELIILRNGAGITNILVYKMPLNFSGTVTLLASLQVGSGLYNFKGIAAGDFDGDGKAEVVVAKDAHSQFIFYALSGSSLVLKGYINLPDDPTLNQWGGVAAGDLDGDGKAEFMAVRNGTGSDDDILVYKVSGTSTWTVNAAGSYNYGGGTTHYPWLGVAIGEFDQDKTNGKEFVLYKNSSAYFSYHHYNGTGTAPSLLSTQDFSSETAWPWTGIAAGQTIINVGGDQLVGIRQKTGGTTLGVFGDISTRFNAKKLSLSRNGFSFGSYYQAFMRNADGSLNVAGLKTFCETNKIYTFAFMMADRWIDPATGTYYPKGTEYKAFIEFLELLKSSGSIIKVIPVLVPPSESATAPSYLPQPGDSPYIGSAELGSGITDERALFSGGASNPNANDFPAWFKLLGILANKYPNLAGINIDDFDHNTNEVGSKIFTRVMLGKMIKNLRDQNEDIAFIPTVYYAVTTGQNWVREYTDGFTFYFRNEKTKNPATIVPPDVTRTGTAWNMHGAIVLPSSDIAGGLNLINTEINDFSAWQANSNRLLFLGIYASTHSQSTTAPTAFTTDKMMGAAKSNPKVHGLMIYTTQQPATPIGTAVYSRFNSWW
ncbi:VCBS repeat-containing protein [Pedobacter heparinus]|uniref:FG-GAP repeat domain-containing protein n=1 Tax=Pedobacter heparinus TaxID=984 RepID=UPI00292DA51B|nr:VCBS repeat-containing protein [Pedobacter heparinus]